MGTVAGVAYLRPGPVLSLVNRLIGVLRLKPMLVVPGRKTGQPREVPVNVLEHEGKRYLVAPRGETQWVRNLRAAGRAELRTRRGVEPIVVVAEVADELKPELITAYRARWERETKQLWKQLPDPADHPAFEVQSA